MADFTAHPQVYARDTRDRLPMPLIDALNASQREVAQALIDGPRKGVYGPFVPLLRCPALLQALASVGEQLRFKGVLDARIRELVTCAAARHTSNQFEWVMHAPLAINAGVAPQTIDAIQQGSRPRDIPPDEEDALDFARELLATHGVGDTTYHAALARWGEQGVVELTTLLGYFVMVSWIMNVARTPSQDCANQAGLDAFPL